ncbi:YHYH protein [Vibrio lamellibrachiae]|uniref:YHYH protein n=1 Tax=Vibrio lamellibrachiae TaxID=2910253 RepID=UPI003D130A8A
MKTSFVLLIILVALFGLSTNSVFAKNDSRGKKPPPRGGKQQQAITLPSSHIESLECSRIKASILDSGFSNVAIICDKKYAYIQSDTYPEHQVMTGITGTNEQIPVPALGYIAPIKLTPKMASDKTTIDASLGIAVNGVPIYDYSSQGELDIGRYNPSKDTILLGQLDQCGGHAGRGDDYHYHAKPTCMINVMDSYHDASIIGWGYDGFPLYTDNNPDGSVVSSGDLDVCNGQADATYGYRYHTSEKPPYIFQCLVGEVDTGILPRVAPLRGANARSDLKPPKDGVMNLKHIELEDGTRSMTYLYQGVEYYSRYKPSSSKDNCYDFEQKTISNNGKVESGTYCR